MRSSALGVAEAKGSLTFDITHFQIHVTALSNPMTPTDPPFALKNKLPARGEELRNVTPDVTDTGGPSRAFTHTSSCALTHTGVIDPHGGQCMGPG